MKPLVLICSKEADFYLVFGHILEEAGFASELAGCVDEAVQLASERGPHAVVLDCQPADAAWDAVCGRLKGDPRSRALPVIALIAPGAENQHLGLLKAGIDEIFVRPFAPAKLLTYLRAKLSRAPTGSDGEDDPSLICGDLKIRLASHKVRWSGQQLHLGPIEFNLLRYLVENRGKVCSRDELIRAAWSDNHHVDTRTVDVHVSRLRKTMKTVSPRNVIRTIRSAGYALDEHDQ
ncbi:response regulator transcription factor [Mesorhizobium sp. B4-1-4]|uniref:response regulator transcription factor n=1 Tax=Mesorhizobium sp. B4-1-4 TaxID=2589888 RepID=UPI00112D75C6|nr:response regulator transcription factor [Mesorhizobium sp. B4-1-4]UCI31960.1 response regulator transcription factor [Mesorhizobium sp. B4-1-4]